VLGSRDRPDAMPTALHRQPPAEVLARTRARRTARAALLGLVCAAAAVAAAPGIALPAVFALPVLASVALACVVGALRRRAAARRPFGAVTLRRRSGGLRAGGLVAGIGSAAVVLGAVVSYAGAMERPSNSSLPIRSVEWLRDNGAAGLVSAVERVYYSLVAPAPGGPGLRALPSVGVYDSVRGVRPGTLDIHLPLPGARNAHRRPAYRPPRVRPVIHPRLPGEGVWAPTQARFDGGRRPPVLVTAYRPDASYPRVVAGLAWFDHARTTLALYPGLQEPPSAGPGAAAVVPPAHRRTLLATFNGGFKHRDSGGGFFSHGHLFEPLVPGQGTILAAAHGRVDVRSWHGAVAPGAGVRLARQNLPLIVDRGRPNPSLNDGPQWGATLGNQILVWRSGIGVDRHGNLIYAAAPDQSVSGLARILIHAGAVRAMELDINSYWVTLNTYGLPGGRDARRLLAGMNRPAQRYLVPDDRDFFAVYLR
jgi:hypothetical protein